MTRTGRDEVSLQRLRDLLMNMKEVPIRVRTPAEPPRAHTSWCQLCLVATARDQLEAIEKTLKTDTVQISHRLLRAQLVLNLCIFGIVQHLGDLGIVSMKDGLESKKSNLQMGAVNPPDGDPRSWSEPVVI